MTLHPIAVGLGEILWDVLPHATLLGGAPANFAYHVNALGGVGIPVSRIGNDDLGTRALKQLVAHGLNVDAITIDSEHPTGTVNASVDAHGVATYVFPDEVAWDFLSFDSATKELAAKTHAVCFGTLAQRSPVSRHAIHSFLKNAPDALKIYDINLRQNFFSPEIITGSLELADVLKINDDELALITDMFALPTDERAALSTLMTHHNLKLAVLTRGSHGSLILSRDEVSDLPGQPTTVVDTIGAGDSFTAALTLAYLNDLPLDEINRYATTVAAFVCGQAGAMPNMPDALKIQA